MSKAIAWAVLSIATALTATPALAEHGAAPYALPPATAQKLVDLLTVPRDAALEGLRAKLEALEAEMGTDADAAKDATAAAPMPPSQLTAHVQQLRTLRRDVMQAVKTLHEAAGTKQGNDVAAKLADRFDRVETALQAVADAKTPAHAGQARAQMRKLLRGLRAPELPAPALVPNLVQVPPQGPVGQVPASKVLPAYALDSLRDDPGQPGIFSAGLKASPGLPLRLIRTAAATPALAPATRTDCYPANLTPAALDAAVADDINADGAEIQFTADIQALAQTLNYSPVQMLDWMQKNVQFQAYRGSMKGAVGVLQTHAGNATDQASLLIALLRSAKIPARYVRGRVALYDSLPSDNVNGRAQRWLGTMNYSASALALEELRASGQVSAGGLQGIQFDHVWVQACVPYAGYRGAAAEAGGYRWVPLDPSIKDQDYQAGMDVNLPLDRSLFDALLATLTDDLPTKLVADRVEALARAQRGDASVEDVPYRGTPKALRLDVLPSTPPFAVVAFTNWVGQSTPETAKIPDSHRLKVKVRALSAQSVPEELASTTLTLPAQVFAKLTVSYAPDPNDANSVDAWNRWTGSGAAAGVVKVYPRLLVDGVEVSNGAAKTKLELGNQHRLVMQISGGDNDGGICVADPGSPQANSTPPIPDPDKTCIYKTLYNNVQAGAYYAIGFNAAQLSPALLHSRAALLAAHAGSDLTGCCSLGDPPPTPASGASYDATVGDLLHLVVQGYMYEKSLAKVRIGELNGARSDAWRDLGLTGSELKTTYAFDLPVVVKPSGVFVDFKGGQLHYTKLASAAPVVANSNEADGDFRTRRAAFRLQETTDINKLMTYADSALEHHVWQETLRTDAVSTVRGLQFASATGIGLITLTPADRDSLDSRLPMSGVDGYANYKTSIRDALVAGANVVIPNRLITYRDPVDPSKAWHGAVFMTDNAAKGEYAAIISGGFAGGYPLINSTPLSILFNTNTSAPSAGSGVDLGVSQLTALPTGQQGSNPLATLAGDPVNMLTGSFVFSHTDLIRRAERGIELVFTRWYNSSSSRDVGLGVGWTHSFAHMLNLYGVENGRAKVGWVNGSGGESFFSTTNIVNGAPAPGSTLTPSPGVWATLTRGADGSYTLTEQDGTSYAFELANTTNRYRLQSITDRKGRRLTVTYSTARQVQEATQFDRIERVSSPYNYGLNFTWSAFQQRILQVDDGTRNVRFDDLDDEQHNLNWAIDARGKVHNYKYYTQDNGPKRPHHLKQIIHPKGNGLKLEYYSNGQVFRHTALDTSGNPIPDSTNTFEYNPFTRESTSTNERGYQRSFLFNKNGNLLRLTDENGAITHYTYDEPANPFNRLTETDPIGRTTSYTYERANLVSSVKLPNGATVEMRDYNAFSQPQRTKDAMGNWTWLAYDANGNLIERVALAAGVTPTAGTRPAAANMKAWTLYGYYDGQLEDTQRVSDFSTKAGPFTGVSHDGPQFNVLYAYRSGNFNGQQVSEGTSRKLSDFAYDPYNRPLTGVDARWYPTQSSWDEEDRPLTATDALGQLRSFHYDDNGNLDGQKLLKGTTQWDSTTPSYDDRDRLVSQADAGGNVRSFTYDGAGNVTQVTSPDGYSTSIVYDPANRPVAAFDESGNRVFTQLDTVGRPLTVTDPNGNVTTYSYWTTPGVNFGRLKRITQPAIQGQPGRAVEFNYDAAGRVVKTTRIASDGSTRDSYSFYDELGRVVRSVGERDSSNGNQRLQTCSRFDNLSNLKEVWAGPTTDTTSGTCTFSAPLKQQLTQTWDDFGHLLSRTDALGKTWNYTYDYYGNPDTIKSPAGRTLTYNFDRDQNGGVNGLPFSITGNDGTSTSTVYNPLGQPTQQGGHAGGADASVIYNYDYDATHRLKSVTDVRGEGLQTLAYDWTPGGRLSSLQLKAGNAAGSTTHRWDYKYDNLGRLALIVPPNGQNVGFTYDPAGRLLERTVARAATSASATDAAGAANNSLLRSAYAWLADGSLQSLTHLADATPLVSTTYDFDVWGNRWHAALAVNSDNVAFSETRTHGYDSLDRLTSLSPSASSSWVTPDESYTYDLFGNRKTRTSSTAAGTTSWSYQYDDAQRLTSYSQTAGTSTAPSLLFYDLDGNLTNHTDCGFGGKVDDKGAGCSTRGSGNQTTLFSWNTLNQLTSVAPTYAGTAQPVETYGYDGSGRRTSKVRSFYNSGGRLTSSTATRYLYNGADIAAEWVNNYAGLSGMPTAAYTHAGTDAPVLRHTDSAEGGPGSSGQPTGASQVYAQDGLGSVIAMLGVPGQTANYTALQLYDAWGNVVNADSVPTFGFTGREPDATGLIYYRARYYHPGLGRFLSRDPLGLGAGINPYAYVNGNPVNLVDPMGRDPYKPYPTLNDALIAGARWNASQTAGVQNATNLPIEFASRVFSLEGSFYHTPGVASFYRGRTGLPVSNPSLEDNMIPAGAVLSGETHSHPFGFSRNPSPDDQSRASQLNMLPSAVGNMDGSVIRYDGSLVAIGGRIGRIGQQRIAQPMENDVAPYNFRDAAELEYPMPQKKNAENPANAGNSSSTPSNQATYGK